MGIDISFCVEREQGSSWCLVRRGDGEPWWFDERNYECFSLLTGLDFSQRLIRPPVGVASPRGWPDDMSDETRSELLGASDHTAFSRSWLGLDELVAFDWERHVEWTYMASPPTGIKVTEKVQREISNYARENGRPPQGWSVAGWSRDGFTVTVPITCRRLAGDFIGVVDELVQLAGPTVASWRCIFEFTR